MSKAAKPAAEATPAAPPPKNKKKLIIIIAAALSLVLVGGTVAFLLLKPAKPAHNSQTADGEEQPTEEVVEEKDKVPPKFVDLGTFTTNLVSEDGEHVVQAVIALKITKPELEEKIKHAKPEISHYINLILQSKRPSDIADIAGKNELAKQIKEHIEYVLGFRKTIAPITAPPKEGEPVAQAEAPKKPKKAEKKIKSDVADVLFTSFLVQ